MNDLDSGTKRFSDRTLIWIGAVLLLILLAIIVSAAVGNPSTLQLPQDQQLVPVANAGTSTPEASTEMLKGYFFVSGAFNTQASLLNTYAIAADGSRGIGIGGTADSVGNMYSFTRDAKTAVFIGTTQDLLQQFVSGTLPAGGVRQVYREQLAGGNFPTPVTATQLTSNNVPNKQMPAVSDDGSLVAYVSASTSVPAVDASTIHLVNTIGDRTLFAGSDPQWFSATAFYYVAPDGIRLYDVAASSSSLVLPVEGQTNFRIAVSPDRTLFAFSNPDASAVSFFSIGANGNTLRLLKTLAVEGYWDVFSPDNRYTALQTIDPQTAQPLIDVFTVGDFSQVRTIHLGGFLNDRLFVTAWLY